MGFLGLLLLEYAQPGEKEKPGLGEVLVELSHHFQGQHGLLVGLS
jgi:hypothetical protein